MGTTRVGRRLLSSAPVALAIFLCAPQSTLAQYRLDWGLTGAGSGGDGLTSVAVADDGSILAVGETGGRFRFMGRGLDGPGHFVLKVRDRALVFLRALPNDSTFEVTAARVAAGAEGELWITGAFRGTGSLGSTTLTSPSLIGGYLAKLDASGAPVFARTLTGATGGLAGLSHFSAPQLVSDGTGGVFVGVGLEDERGRPIPTGISFTHVSRSGAQVSAFSDERLVGFVELSGLPGRPIALASEPQVGWVSDAGVELFWRRFIGRRFFSSPWPAPTGEVLVASYDIGEPWAVTMRHPEPYGISLHVFTPTRGELRATRRVADGDLVSGGARVVDQGYGNALAGIVYGAGEVAGTPIPLRGPPGDTSPTSFLVPTVLGAIRAPKLLPDISVVALAKSAPNRVILGGSYQSGRTIDGVSFPEPAAGPEPAALRADVWLAEASIDSDGLTGALPDRHEGGIFPLGAFSHRHWRCPSTRLHPDGSEDCSDVFEGGLVHREAEDVFTWIVPDLTLHVDSSGAIDADEFLLTLPDITDAGLGEYHANVQPLGERVVPGTTPPIPVVVPLADCATYRRRDTAHPRYEDLTVHGSLVVSAVPGGATPLSTERTTIRAFATTEGDLDSLATSTANRWSLGCPEFTGAGSPLPLRTLRLRVSQGPGAGFPGGEYSLQVEYKIEARRSVPDWIGALANMKSLRCAGGGRFPDCPGELPRFDLSVPDRKLDPNRPVPMDCLSAPPLCFDVFDLDLPGGPIRLTFDTNRPGEIDLKDFAGNTVARAVAGKSSGKLQSQKLTLDADTKPGTYFLRVSAPGARISGTMAPGPPKVAKPPVVEPRRDSGYWWFGLLGVAMVSATAAFVLTRSRHLPG